MVRKKGVVWFLGHQPPPFKQSHPCVPNLLLLRHRPGLGCRIDVFVLGSRGRGRGWIPTPLRMLVGQDPTGDSLIRVCNQHVYCILHLRERTVLLWLVTRWLLDMGSTRGLLVPIRRRLAAS